MKRLPAAEPLLLSQRIPPHNLEAEQSLLGTLMANNKTYERVRHFLRPEHFADTIHARIYEAIQRRVEAGRLADAVTLKAEFENSGVLEEVGGTTYLAQLLTAMVAPIMAGEYGMAVHEAWVRRRMIEVGEQMIARAFAQDVEPQVALATAHDELGKLPVATADMRSMVTFTDAMDQALADADAIATGRRVLGLSTGMPSVDREIGGLENGGLYLLAGRPGSGKSTLGLQWAVDIARAGHGVLAISLEMTATALARRTLASMAKMPLRALRTGTHADYAVALIEARRELADLPFLIEDGGNRTVSQIMALARLAARRVPLELIVVDHMHIVSADDPKQPPTQQLTAISKGMKMLAKELNIPVLALAQLNRGVENRDDKRPGLSDLRQSGSLEQDADCVMFVHRPEMFLPKSAPERSEGEGDERYAGRVAAYHTQKARLKGVAELILDKVRDGEPMALPMRFDGPTVTFFEPRNPALEAPDE